jgi:hypothetical protein
VEILFRSLGNGAGPPPDAGEIHIRPRTPEDRERRDYARLVLQRGIAVFASGEGPIRRIVVDTDPTLDDLLAATITRRLLAGEDLPKGLGAFAHYAALVREGLKPSAVPLEDSLEGIFLAVRNAGGGDLTDGAVAVRFAADWERMAACIIQAAARGADPFTTTLFEAGPEFARERAFLVRDHAVYRQDVLSGEQWSIRIPGGPPQGTALLLRRPKSLLFQYWSRRGDQAAAGQTFLLLAVYWGPGQWVFSTDPVLRLPLKPLAEALQAAEVAQASDRAALDPWFDGKPFGYTLVAAPKGGSVLLDAKVLRIVKDWTGARLVARGKRARAAALAAALLICVGLAWRNLPSAETNRGFVFEGVPSNGIESSEKGTLHVVTVGITKYQKSTYNLDVAGFDAKELGKAFARQARPLFAKIRPHPPLIDGDATRKRITQVLADLKAEVKPNDLVVVTLSGHGDNFGEEDDFYFLAFDFDPEMKESEGVVNGDTFTRLLGRLGCRVLLVLDTCHSGAVTSQLRSKSKKGTKMVVMAACLGSQFAKESRKWGHGVLTLALLEGLQGKHIYKGQTDTPELPGKGEDKIISLADLDYYATKRVAELTNSGQAYVSSNSGDFSLDEIKIASLKAGDAKRAP